MKQIEEQIYINAVWYEETCNRELKVVTKSGVHDQTLNVNNKD